MPPDPQHKERICIVAPDFPVLGGMRSVLLVLLSLLEVGSEPLVLARKWGDSGYTHLDLGLSPRFRRWFSPWFLSTLPLYELSGFLWCLVLRLRGVRKFLVQDTVFSGLFAGIICRALGGELYLFDYGSAVNVDNGLLMRELSRIQPRKVADLQLRVMRLIRWFSLRLCKIFFVHSSEMRELALSSGLAGERIVDYMFPVDGEVYRRNEKARSRLRNRLEASELFVVLYAGRMTLDKGLLLLLESYSLLERKYPHALGLVLMGAGPEKAALMRRSELLGLERVAFLNPVGDPHRVAGIMSAADVFVYPIVFSGGIAMAVLEAMACELPVIVGPAGPTKTVILHGKNGFVLRSLRARETANLIGNLLEHPELCRTIGARARRTVTRKFGVKQYRLSVIEKVFT